MKTKEKDVSQLIEKYLIFKEIIDKIIFPICLRRSLQQNYNVNNDAQQRNRNQQNNSKRNKCTKINGKRIASDKY